MPALYALITFTLPAPVFRGVSLEYRWRVKTERVWDPGLAGAVSVHQSWTFEGMSGGPAGTIRT
ncbi:hypothetical protein [Roseobacter sinensis]|nr:hypothetical protein [Roseobacter sp. WL0113]